MVPTFSGGEDMSVLPARSPRTAPSKVSAASKASASPSKPLPSKVSASNKTKSPRAPAKGSASGETRTASPRPERVSRLGNKQGPEGSLNADGTVVAARPEHFFEVGQLAVHPAHGVGTVASIEEKDFGGTLSIVYVLNIVGSGLRVMVPKIAAARVGLRPVMSDVEADEILAVLSTAEVAVTVQPWNRRFRAYTEMIASGSAREIAKVLRDMNRLKSDKELSFGERRLLDQAKGLLVQELALAKQKMTDEMEATIERIFAA